MTKGSDMIEEVVEEEGSFHSFVYSDENESNPKSKEQTSE